MLQAILFSFLFISVAFSETFTYEKVKDKDIVSGPSVERLIVNVPDEGKFVYSADVYVELEYPVSGDVRIWVERELDGSIVNLVVYEGDSRANLFNGVTFTFNGQNVNEVIASTSGNGPLQGNLGPDDGADNLKIESTEYHGKWTVKVQNQGQDTGVLKSIAVIFHTTAPTTDAPTTVAPTTDAPTTDAPTTDAPTTDAPTTDAPTTDAPTTDAPTTDAPTTDAPTTDAPTTPAPSSFCHSIERDDVKSIEPQGLTRTALTIELEEEFPYIDYIKFSLEVEYPAAKDLRMWIEGPNGWQSNLVTREGGDYSELYTSVTWSENGIPVSQAIASLTQDVPLSTLGDIKPDSGNSLAFGPEIPFLGKYQLKIDNQGNSVGKLEYFKVEYCIYVEPTDSPVTDAPTSELLPTTRMETDEPTTTEPATTEPATGFIPTTLLETEEPSTTEPTTDGPTDGPTGFVPTTLLQTEEPFTTEPFTTEPIEPTEEPEADQTYYIGIEEVMWNYLPDQWDGLHNLPVEASPAASQTCLNTPYTIGSTYKKALYYLYTEDFGQKMEKSVEWGFQGPLITAHPGDSIKIVLRNNANYIYSISTVGLEYMKSSQGAAYGGHNAEEVGVLPGETREYWWYVPDWDLDEGERMLFSYHSAVSPEADIASGLFGPILIVGEYEMDDIMDMRIKRDMGKWVDDFFLFPAIVDENKSHYIDWNIMEYAPSVMDKNEPTFVASNMMASFNGYSFLNLPGLHFCKGTKLYWHVYTEGSSQHNIAWRGNASSKYFRHVYPGSAYSVEMHLENGRGSWLIQDSWANHFTAGIAGKYYVEDCEEM